MKRIIFTLITAWAASLCSYAQTTGTGYCGSTAPSGPGICTPSTTFTSPGLYPLSDQLGPIVIGVDTAITINFKNFNTVTFDGLNLTVQWVQIDTINNFPTGMCWSTDTATNTFLNSENGCIVLRGTPEGAPGQYRLNIAVTANVGVSVPENANALGLYYYVRLVCPGDVSSHPLDTTGQSANTNTFIPYTACTSGLSVSILSSNVKCNGQNNGTAKAVATGGSSYTYLWSNGNTMDSIGGLSPNTYSVTVTSGSSTASAEVTIIEPSALTVSASATNVNCYGQETGSVTAVPEGGTAPYRYSWTGGSTSEPLQGVGAGTYDVTVTDNNQCTATASATVTQPSSSLTVNATVVNNVKCYGADNGSATLTADGGTTPYSYLWSSGSTAATAPNLVSGLNTGTVTDHNQCTATASVTLTEPTAISIGITTVPSSGSNGSATATASGGGGGPYSYLWNTGQTTGTIHGLAPNTTVIVTVTDNDTCSASDTAVVMVSGISSVTGPLKNVTLFPNPANDAVNLLLETEQPQTVQITVTDVTGKQLYTTRETSAGKQLHSINVSAFASGIYIVNITAENQSVRERFEVTH